MEFTNLSQSSDRARGLAGQTGESRYILPSFEERTAYGYKRQDP
jgi:ATP-dependent Clp protease protease subunit